MGKNLIPSTLGDILQALVVPTRSGSGAHRGGISLSSPLQGQHLAFPAVALWVTVGLAVCVVGLLAVLAYVCQKKIRQSCEEEENAGNTAATSPQRGWGLQRVTEGDGWGELGQILTGMDLPWWWHLLGAAGVGRHQQIRAREPVLVHRSRQLFQTYTCFTCHPACPGLSPSSSEHPLRVWYPQPGVRGASLRRCF